ncbi:MAG: DAK2 domain-containing protein, partial [Bacteroidales bacterium]|nr:DAK2 domain-containing protein [Bacteroidales bacterium]
MTSPAEKLTSLSGKSLFYIFMAGAHNILENQKELNRINVFPVPDGDTGTNLASTIRSIVSNIKPETSYKKQADLIAEAALVGARGNSGVIFAQFLYGLGNETHMENEVSVQSFADSVKKAVDYMYQAIANPVEGTMITVIREWAEFIHENKERLSNFFDLLYESYLKALESLKDTPKKLEALAKANVVDAGAKGFVLFLEGILQWAQSKNLRQIVTFKYDTEIEIDEINNFDHENFTFRYCTEAFVEGTQINHKELRQAIE